MPGVSLEKHFSRLLKEIAQRIEQVEKNFDRLLAEQDRRIEQAQQSAGNAVQKAETAIDKRLELLNEFRGQAADEANKYVRKEEVVSLLDRITKLEKSRDYAYGGILFAAFLGVASLVKLFWG